MDTVTIIVNSTETGVIAALTNLQAQRLQLKQSPQIELEIMPLTTGDGIFCAKGAFERKRGDDYVNSMKDGRMDEEIPRMLSVYPISVLIVEQPEMVWAAGFAHSSIYGMQAKLATYIAKDGRQWKLPTIFTTGIEGTALAIERLAFWTQHTPADKPVRYDRPKYANVLEYRIIQIQATFLDTGPVLAQLLLDKFGNLYNIMQALGASTVKETDNGNVKWGVNAIEIKGLGPMWVKNNRELCGMNEVIPNG